MRYGADHKKQTHDRIVSEAARLFRTQGYEGCGVDAVMASVGLTAGGFYSHFKNKDALLSEVLDQCFADGAARLLRFEKPDDGGDPLQTWVDAYLSRAHRDTPGRGCPIPALGGEVPRQAKSVRAAFTRTLRKRLEILAQRVPAATPEQRGDEAIRILASSVGAMLLARAVSDPQLSEHILHVMRSSLRPGLQKSRRPAAARTRKST